MRKIETFEQFLNTLKVNIRKFKGNFWINKKRMIRERNTGLCPICWLVYVKTGKRYSNKKYNEAAKTIKLSNTYSIISAADSCFDYKRIDLQKACGIQK